MASEAIPHAGRLLDLVGEVQGASSLGEFRTTLMDALARAIPCDWVAYNEVSDRPEETFVISSPPVDPALVPRFAELADENPLIRSIRLNRDGRPRRISDMVDQATYHSTAIYREVYALMRVEAQVAFTLPASPPLILGIALSRGDGDFTDEEVQLLAVARPHLIQAYRNAELASAREATLEALEHGLGAIGRHVVVLDARGSVQFATDGAARLLGARPRAQLNLPAPVREWVAGPRRELGASQPLVLQVGDSRVFIRMLPAGAGDRRTVLLVEGDRGGLAVSALESLGLTAREAQVLQRIALGDTAAQAAAAMSIAVRTAEKHLQSVYDKLGVHTRAEASATAWAAVGVESPSPAVPRSEP